MNKYELLHKCISAWPDQRSLRENQRCRHRPTTLANNRRNRRTGARSIDNTSTPSGNIQKPTTGRNPKTPPTISNTPKTRRCHLDPGNAKLRPTSFTTRFFSVLLIWQPDRFSLTISGDLHRFCGRITKQSKNCQIFSCDFIHSLAMRRFSDLLKTNHLVPR